MVWIKLALSGFLLLEISNVIALYFFPDSKMANSVGVFNAWEKSKRDAEVHNLVKYLVNWVAGTKLIFILLLAVILFRADSGILPLAAGVLAAAISTFFWRLFPLIRQMDLADQVSPKNYSSVLGWMILSLLLILSASILISVL